MVDGNGTSECRLWPNKQFKCDVVKFVQLICPSLSIAGSFFIILVIWLFKLYHVFVQRLILALAFSACLQSVSYLLGNIYSHNVNSVCYAQSFMMQYFLWATLSWVILISFNMLLITHEIQSQKYEIYYHLLGWLNPLFWTLLPLFMGTFGHAGIWCWIKKEYTMVRFGVWYLPLLIVCVALGSVYLYIYCYNKRLIRTASTVYRANKTEEKKIYRNEVKPLVVYPFIYICLTIPIFVYRLYDALHPDEEPLFGLLIVAVLSAPSVGTVNAVSYAFYNKTIRELTWSKLKQAVNARMRVKAYKVTNFNAYDFKDDNRKSIDTSQRDRNYTSTVLQDISPPQPPLAYHNSLFLKENDVIATA